MDLKDLFIDHFWQLTEKLSLLLLLKVDSTQYHVKSLPSGAQTELTPDVAEVVLVIPEVPIDFASALFFRARFLQQGHQEKHLTKPFINVLKTRMPSSRMRTAR